MKMSGGGVLRANWSRTVKEMICKMSEVILTTRLLKKIPSFRNTSTLFQTPISEPFKIRERYPVISSHSLNAGLNITLELYAQVQGCTPLLLEKWSFKYIPSSKSTHSSNFYQDACILVRSLMLSCLMLPAFSYKRGNLAYNFIWQNTSGIRWHRSLPPKLLKRHPRSAFRLDSSLGEFEIFVEYYTEKLKPEVRLT